jgi:hypothetical protein
MFSERLTLIINSLSGSLTQTHGAYYKNLDDSKKVGKVGSRKSRNFIIIILKYRFLEKYVIEGFISIHPLIKGNELKTFLFHVCCRLL